MDAPYQKNSETSKAAAESIKRAMSTQRHLIYCIFVANPDTAFTDNDLIEYVTEHDIGVSINAVRPRRIELLRYGMIEECGTRAGKSGRLAKQYRAK